jgi:type II secretory ATPase GspE/PulE/Tfp pilus assembly ATPase PilB-like protein
LSSTPRCKLVRERADAHAIARAAADTGMRPLREDALAKAILQQTTLEEVERLSSRSGRDIVPRIG